MRPFPLPSDIQRTKIRPGDSFVRAATAIFLNAADQNHSGPAEFLKRLWPDDAVAPIILRSATTPASMTTSGWASPLAATSVADFLGSLGPIAAGSTLLNRSLKLIFNGSGAIVVPVVVSAATGASFVQEGAPIPVRQHITAGATLNPRNLKVISAFTRELSQHSTPNVESLVRAIISQDVGLALDAALFGTAAADATAPAGIRNGVAALTASVLTPANEAFFADIRALASAVAPVAANGPIIFIANPAQAVSLRLRLAGDPTFEVLSSSALSAGVIVAVAANALASAIDPQPRFEISNQASLHFDDSPSAISTVGSPNTVAALSASLFQNDTLALRTVFQADWTLRAAGAVAWLTTTAW